MDSRGVLSLLALLALVYAAPYGTQKKHDRQDWNTQPHRIVCYWGSWAYYHDAPSYKDAFRLEAGDLDDAAQLCTHIIYTFAKIDEWNHTMVPFDPDLELHQVSWGHDYYKKFIAMKEKNPKLTLMIAVGGWFEGSEKFSDMARVPTVRKRFVDNVVKFLKEYGFDGLDVDWEYPANRLGKPEDKQNYISLMTELNEAFREEEFILTTALSPGKGTIDKAYDKDSIAKLNELLDWANVMTYDYHGGFDDPPYLGHNAPLYRRPDEVDDIHIQFTINYTIHYYLELGLKKEKMVMGLPFYGRGFTLKDPGHHNIGELGDGMSPAGRLSGQDGILGFNELCELESKGTDGGWHNSYDPYYCAPYAYNEKEWIGYDNEDSIICKVSFLKEMGLSGGMAWSLEFDDFKGDKCKGGKNPLLHTTYNYLNGAKKDVRECNLHNVTPAPTTPTPTTPTTRPTTTPTTPTTTPTTPPTTPTTPRPTTTPTTPPTTPTTPRPTTTPTTPPTTPTTTPPTTRPTTPSPTTEHVTGSPMVTMTIPGGHTIRCYKEGPIPHPTDPYKYVVCQHVKTGPNQGWYIHIMGCAPGTKWNQPKEECVDDY